MLVHYAANKYIFVVIKREILIFQMRVRMMRVLECLSQFETFLKSSFSSDHTSASTIEQAVQTGAVI